MNHQETLARAHDHVDGVLSKRERRKVEAHLDTCPACAREFESIRALVARANDLPTELEPKRNLWPGIKERLGPQVQPAPRRQEQGNGMWVWLLDHGLREGLAAAAAVAVLIVGVFHSPQRNNPPGSDLVVTNLSSGTSRSGPEATTFARMVWGFEGESRGVGRTLITALQDDPGPLRAEDIQAIDQSLETLGSAIAEASAALEEDPENPILIRRLSGYHKKRLVLLKMATQLTARS
jgi:hypothetical protein